MGIKPGLLTPKPVLLLLNHTVPLLFHAIVGSLQLPSNTHLFLKGNLTFFFTIIWQQHTVLQGNQGAQEENPPHGLAEIACVSLKNAWHCQQLWSGFQR